MQREAPENHKNIAKLCHWGEKGKKTGSLKRGSNTFPHSGLSIETISPHLAHLTVTKTLSLRLLLAIDLECSSSLRKL